jgi:hypothetical protein
MIYPGSVYQHYKSKEYYRVLIADAKREADGEATVVYQNMHVDKPQVWVRSEKSFHTTVQDAEGNEVPRFRLLTVTEQQQVLIQATTELRAEAPKETIHYE